MLEMEVFKGCQLEVTILADDQPLPIILNFPHVNHVDDDINQMTNNVLYHVHPIIDGVGLDLLLMKLVNHWLVICDLPRENRPSLHLVMIVEIPVSKFLIGITSFCSC